MVSIGDYTRARLANGDYDTSGVYIADLGYGYILLQGEGDRYVCLLEGAVKIPDENLRYFPDKLEMVQRIRQSLQS